MELDELKLHLKQKLDTGQPAKTQEEITVLLGKDTLSVLGKIRRSLVFEIVCCVVFILICAITAIVTSYWSLRIYFAIFTFVFIPFFIILLYLLKKMNQANSNPMPVKKNVETLYALLKEFVKRYFQFTMGLIPVCLIVAMWLGYHEPDKSLGDNAIKFNNNTTLFIFLLVYVAALATGMYFFTKWYLKKLYGNYLLQLKGLIKELDEEAVSGEL